MMASVVGVVRSRMCKICKSREENANLLNMMEVGPNKENWCNVIHHFYGVQINTRELDDLCICRNCLKYVIDWVKIRKDCLMTHMVKKFFRAQIQQGIETVPPSTISDFYSEINLQLTRSNLEVLTEISLEPLVQACINRLLCSSLTPIIVPSLGSNARSSLVQVPGPALSSLEPIAGPSWAPVVEPSSISSSSIVHDTQRFNNKNNNLVEKTNNTPPNTGLVLSPSKINSTWAGSYDCYNCKKRFLKLEHFIKHIKKHNKLYRLKDSEILLCPVCDKNYAKLDYFWHLEYCTKSMLFKGNYYGCPICQRKIKAFDTYKFRLHFIYCNSFETLKDGNDQSYYKCINCTFKHYNLLAAYKHANGYCIYFQLKMNYALSIDEKKEVEEKKLAITKYSKIDHKVISINSQLNPTLCNLNRQKLLDSYEYLCRFCEKRFYSECIFKRHLNANGVQCRSPDLQYCKFCVCDFDSVEKLSMHLNYKIEPSILNENKELNNKKMTPCHIITIDESK